MTPAGSAFIPPGPIHHIGIVVDDLDAAIEAYRNIGWEPGETVRLLDQQVDIVPVQADESWIEILKPLSQDSAIGRYLDSRGPGFHHVAYLVDNLDATLESLRSSAIELIDEQPRIGLHGWKIAFLHPRSCAGVLTELVERGSTI